MVLIFVIWCSTKVFGVDKEAVSDLDGSLIGAGTALQICFLIMLIRDLCFTSISCFKSNSSKVMESRIVAHFLCACCDNLLLIGFSIWAEIMMHKPGADECLDILPEEAGCKAFYKATRANIIIAYLYLLLHCCCWPCLLFVAIKWIEKRENNQRRNREDRWEEIPPELLNQE